MKHSSQKTISIAFHCRDERIANILAKCLEPENAQLDDKTSIETFNNLQHLIVVINSSSSFSSIRYTVDDIMKTINLSENILKEVSE